MSISPDKRSGAATNRLFLALLMLIAVMQVAKAPLVYSHAGEDCFITFRYAQNLALGHGLVYNTNPPEWVEGYSNFLWTLIVAIPAALGWSQKVFAQIVNSILLGLLCLQAGWWARRWSREAGVKLPLEFLLLPALLIGFDSLMTYHVDRCLETLLLSVTLLGAAQAAACRRWALSGLFLGLVAINRPEGFLFIFPFLFIPVTGWILDTLFGRFDWDEKNGDEKSLTKALLQSWPRMAGIFMAIFLPLLMWRYITYGALLPNTVAAKVFGPEIKAYKPLLDYISARGALWWLAVFGAGIGLFQGAKFRRHTIAAAAGFGAMTVLYLGIGDSPHFAYRYYIPVVPFQGMLAWAGIASLWRMMDVLGEGRATLTLFPGGSVMRRVASLVIVVMLFWQALYIRTNGDAAETRLHTALGRAATSAEYRANTWNAFFGEPVRLHSEAGRWLAANILHDALLANDQMGQLGYYAPHNIIDLLGLMDRHIATNGLTTKHLLERAPDFVIIFAPDYRWRSDIWPLISEIHWAPDFHQAYELATVIKANNPVEIYQFQVYARRGTTFDHDWPPITRIGLSGKEWFKVWRVHSDKFIDQLNLP